MFRYIAFALVFLSMTRNGGDSVSLFNDNDDLAIKSNLIDKKSLKRDAAENPEQSLKRDAAENPEPVPTWNEIIASTIVNNVKHMFRADPEPPDPLHVEKSPLVEFFGKLLQFHRDIVYGKEQRRSSEESTGEEKDPTNELDSPGANPKDDVEIVHPDILMQTHCPEGNCGKDVSERSYCPPGEFLDLRGSCVPISNENPSKYFVRVPLQCPDGYRAQAGVCRLVW